MPHDQLEHGREYKNQRELYPLTPELRAVNFGYITTKEVTIGESKTTRSFGGALKEAFKGYFDGIKAPNADTRNLVAATLARAVNAGFNVDFVHTGEHFHITEDTLFYTTANGKLLKIMLSDTMQVGEDPQAARAKLKEYVTNRSKLKEDKRAEWETVLEADMTHVIFDQMKARGLKYTKKNIQVLWNQLAETGSDFIPAMQKWGDKRLVAALEKNPGLLQEKYDSSNNLHQLALAEYLRSYGLDKVVDENTSENKDTNDDAERARVESSTWPKDLVYKVYHLGEAVPGKEPRGDVYTRAIDTDTEFGKQNIIIQLVPNKGVLTDTRVDKAKTGLRTIYTLPNGKKIDRTFVTRDEVITNVQKEFRNCADFRKTARDNIVDSKVVPEDFYRTALETEVGGEKMFQVGNKDGKKTLMVSQYPNEQGKYRVMYYYDKKVSVEYHVDVPTAIKAVLEKEKAE